MQGFIGRVDFLQILPGRYQILTMEATEDSNREHFFWHHGERNQRPVSSPILAAKTGLGDSRGIPHLVL